MEKFVKELLTEDILEKVSNLYNLKKDELYFVGGFENFIYGFTKNDNSYIVRITHSSHRNMDEIKSEIDFIYYLAQNEANVSMPINTINNVLVEEIECSDESYFIISAFTKALGEAPNKANFSDKMIYNYGKTIGKFHQLTKDYMESTGIKKRYSFDKDILILNAGNYITENDKEIKNRLDEIIKEINNIPKNINNYGLIHSDVHMGNFFVDNDELTVFDFDDLSYQYFASDIAIALFYLIFMVKEEDQFKIADRFMTHFMKGYLEINQLDVKDYLKIPLFLDLRQIVLYVVIHQTLDISQNKFATTFIERYRDRIINKVPFIDIDLKKYYFI